MDPFNCISVCAGIGGLDLGVRRAIPNARTVCYVEREAFACEVLAEKGEAGLLDQAPVFTDLRTFDGAAWRGQVDLIFGGIPCQPHSVAGKQLRGDDERDLIDDFLRVVGDVGPSLVFVENVRGFVSGDGLGQLLGGLADLGFDAEWTTLRASEVGAPHRRERVFVLAYASHLRGSGILGKLHEADGGSPPGGPRESSVTGGGVAYNDSGRRLRQRAAHDDNGYHAQRDDANGCDSRMEHAERPRLEGAPGSGLNGEGGTGGESPSGRGEGLEHPRSERLEGQQQAGTAPRPTGRAGGEWPATWPPGPSDGQEWAGLLGRDPGLAPALLADCEVGSMEVRSGRDEQGPGQGKPRGRGCGSRQPGGEENAPKSDLRRVADGPSSRVDRLRALGNAVVPAQATAALTDLLGRIA